MKEGEQVKEGQVIALSGNTGFSSGPHLHFTVYIQRMGKKDTVKTKFRTGTGEKSEYLKPEVNYARNYD